MNGEMIQPLALETSQYFQLEELYILSFKPRFFVVLQNIVD